MKTLTEDRILEFLKGVEGGSVVLTPTAEPRAIIVTYTASNGWRLAVFNDAGEWDYIEWIEVDGERVAYDEIERDMPVVAAYQPSNEVVDRAYHFAKLRAEPLPSPDEIEADARGFSDVREVLAGHQRFPLDSLGSKMLRIFFEGGGVDAWIGPEAFRVQFGPYKSRRHSTYYRRLAPMVVSELLVRAHLDRVTEPFVIGLPAHKIPKTSGFPEWSYSSRVVWILPSAEGVRIMTVPSHEQYPAPFVKPIPPTGPLALPEFVDWVPHPKTYKELHVPLQCPRCGQSATRYRELRDALICPHCARSFVPRKTLG